MCHLELSRLLLNSAGAASYFLCPSGAQHLVASYERFGVAVADAFINQTQGWRIWQLMPANSVQISMVPDFGLPPIDHSESVITREQQASAIAPSLTVLWQMKLRRLVGELNKAWRRLSTVLLCKHTRVPFMNYDHR